MKLFGRKHSSLKTQIQLSLFALTAALLFFSPDLKNSQAAFTLNFIPDDGSYTSTGNDTNYSCNMSYISDFNCDSRGSFDESASHDDGTAAYQRVFTSGGKSYYHVIIGDYTQDTFYMEYMIEASGSWGQYDGRSDMLASASAYPAGSISSCGTSSCERNMNNPYDTNSTDYQKTGTGTGNPNRVIMRMILDDGVTYSEFLKDQFDKKPLIHQSMTDNTPSEGITIDYTLDMRNKTYSDNTPIDHSDRTNQTFLVGDTAANQGDYDSTGAVATPISFREGNDDITAGAFTYTTGSGFGGSNGTYIYYLADGVTVDNSGFDPTGRSYVNFCIESQNTDWSGNGACKNGSGSGSGRSGGWGGWGGW